MHSITINIRDEQLVEKVTWMLEHFKGEGLEIISKEDSEHHNKGHTLLANKKPH